MQQSCPSTSPALFSSLINRLVFVGHRSVETPVHLQPGAATSSFQVRAHKLSKTGRHLLSPYILYSVVVDVAAVYQTCEVQLTSRNDIGKEAVEGGG